MEASQVLENELHLEVDGFVFKFYPRVWPRNYIGIVSEKQIAEMRKYLVYRSSHVVTQGTKLWWHLYFYREPRKNSTPLYDIEKRPIHSCGEVGYVHKRPDLKNISLLSLSCGKQLPFNRSNLIKGRAIL